MSNSTLEDFERAIEARLKRKRRAKAVGYSVGVPITLALLIGLYLLDGWAVTVLWRWYAVPLGLPVLTVAWAIGIILLLASLSGMGPAKPSEKVSSRELGLWALRRVLRPGVLVGIGWLARRWL